MSTLLIHQFLGVDNEYINSPITNTPPDVFKAGYSIEDVGEALPLYDQLWTEVKGG
ncbi:MAG: hypothetical protein AABZ58_07870 [Chloroflexota bacterium]